eukprot:365604-Chlamydomonas_euryale.AAC.13
MQRTRHAHAPAARSSSEMSSGSFSAAVISMPSEIVRVEPSQAPSAMPGKMYMLLAWLMRMSAPPKLTAGWGLPDA